MSARRRKMGKSEVKEGRVADFIQRTVATAIERDLKDRALREDEKMEEESSEKRFAGEENPYRDA